MDIEYNEEADESEDTDFCYTCMNRGYIVTCLDDSCRREDRCYHSYGNHICPNPECLR